jgi:hypothetical protein
MIDYGSSPVPASASISLCPTDIYFSWFSFLLSVSVLIHEQQDHSQL